MICLTEPPNGGVIPSDAAPSTSRRTIRALTGTAIQATVTVLCSGCFAGFSSRNERIENIAGGIALGSFRSPFCLLSIHSGQNFEALRDYSSAFGSCCLASSSRMIALSSSRVTTSGFFALMLFWILVTSS